jgi:hypothetical protein
MQIKIETDLNGKTHLIEYNNNDGEILFTGSIEDCKQKLTDIIKERHRIAHYTFDGCDTVTDHKEQKTFKSKEFCNL